MLDKTVRVHTPHTHSPTLPTLTPPHSQKKTGGGPQQQSEQCYLVVHSKRYVLDAHRNEEHNGIKRVGLQDGG